MKKPLVSVLLALCAGCGQPALKAPSSDSGGRGPVIEFAYATTDGAEVGSASTRGRATAILFLTTYDLASQLLARRLNDVQKRHVPRVNVAAVVLETPKYVVMAEAFRSSLELTYPVAMADPVTLSGGGPFGKIDRVPTLVVLDGEGREVWRQSGVVSETEIDQALALGSRRGIAPGP